MTSTLPTPPQLELTPARPGWDVVADLTPPQVLNARRVRSLQRTIAAGLLVELVMAAAIGVVAVREHQGAARAYDEEQAVSMRLTAQNREYAPLLAMQTALTRSRGQEAQLLRNEVDLVSLMTQVSASLPTGMALTNEALALDQTALNESPTSGDPAGTAPGNVVPTTSRVIGTVTLSGTGRTLDDLAPFVARLSGLTGAVDVVPTTNARTAHGIDFSVSFSITDEVLTHRFDAADGRAQDGTP